MARDRLFQIKRWIMIFFMVVLVLQVGFVCYASAHAAPIDADLAAKMDQVERVSRLMVASIFLNLAVVLVAVYGVNVSIVNSFRCKP